MLFSGFRPATHHEARVPDIRTLLAGRGSSLRDAFLQLRTSPHVIWRCEFPERGLFGARIELQENEGRGFFDLFEIRDSIYVLTENLVFADECHEFLTGDDLLSFHVRLSGECNLLVGRRSAPLRITAPSLLVWHQPVGVQANEWFAPALHNLGVGIFCRPEFIESGLLAERGTRMNHIRRFLGRKTQTVEFCHLPLTAEILSAAKDLANTPYDGRLRLIHVEAKALELYCLILTAFDRLWEAVEEQFDAHDIQCLQLAREILGSRFNPVPTIPALARELGINESKLKRGFKILFGRTVFEYGLDCRMQHALRLLRDRHMHIGLVAETIGYSHQAAFAAAFKRNFGYRPRQVRKSPVSRADRS
jgi:AraC-like DNA-binding protein